MLPRTHHNRRGASTAGVAHLPRARSFVSPTHHSPLPNGALRRTSIRIMLRQYELVERVKAYDPDADEALLNRAYVYTVQKHLSLIHI